MKKFHCLKFRDEFGIVQTICVNVGDIVAIVSDGSNSTLYIRDYPKPLSVGIESDRLQSMLVEAGCEFL